jgi:hypothetical protein
MAKVNASTQMVLLTKVNGGITNHMDWGMKNMKMDRRFEVILSTELNKDKVDLFGKMDPLMLVN